jgi:pimeloyl-ACP methyl ester carboxylesterase
MSVHRVVEGKGPPLVLSASLGTTHALWEPNVPTLARRYRVLRYDHPGDGASPVGPRTIEGLAREALSLLDELGLEQVTFCGTSLDGMVAMDLRPELAAIKVPATVILGRHDPVVDEENRRLLARAGEVVELDAAHVPNVERPEAFVEALTP